MGKLCATCLVYFVSASTLIAKDPDLGSPKTTFKSYVEAVKAGDYETAKKCWVIDGKNKDAALEVVVGFWTSNRRARVAVIEKLGKEGLSVLGKYDRTDVSDAALDLTLRRIEEAKVELDGDRATLYVRPKQGDDSDLFMLGEKPLPLRRVGKNWHLDASAFGGGDAESFLEPGTWGPLFRDFTAMMNEVADGLKNGKLKTMEDVSKLVEVRGKTAGRKYEDALRENPPLQKRKRDK